MGNPGELPGATLWDTAQRWGERVAGLAFGRGAYENMAECYEFLMAHHRPGDQILIFGFSRGGLHRAQRGRPVVNQFGLLAPHMASMLPTLLHIYFSDRGGANDRWKAITQQTTRLFAAADTRSVDIHFVGVWDTVATLGMWPFDAKFTAAPTVAGKSFVHVRQALALGRAPRPVQAAPLCRAQRPAHHPQRPGRQPAPTVVCRCALRPGWRL